jgi:serine/threonine protein kinase
MGEVWLATEVRLGRKVALKVLPADLTRDPLRVQRFEQEARAASALNHPNVCTIHTLGQTSDGTLGYGSPTYLLMRTKERMETHCSPSMCLRKKSSSTSGSRRRRTYREFLIPAAVANRFGPARVVTEEEQDQIVDPRWKP